MKLCNYFKNFVGENISQKLRFKKIDETRNGFLEETNQNELISKKHKKVCTTLNYTKQFLILASTITGGISISTFKSLVVIPIGIMSSARGLKICKITGGIKKYQSTMNKRKKKHDEIVLLAKHELNSIEVLICKALIDSVISYDKLILINVLEEYNKMKEEIRKLKI